MMRELIEYAISMDGMITAARTGYILQNVSAVSEDEFGVHLAKGDVLHLYITGYLDTLTDMETCCARILIEKYKRKFNADLLQLVMKHGAEEAGHMHGSSGDFAREILAYFEANSGTKGKAG